MLEYLVDHGIDVNAAMEASIAAMPFAQLPCDKGRCGLLLCEQIGTTALACAVNTGMLDAVRFLVWRGAEINTHDYVSECLVFHMEGAVGSRGNASFS